MISAFDLDHTLFTANCSFRFGIYLYRQRVFTTFMMIYLLGCYGLHKAGLLSLSKVHKVIFDKFFHQRDLDIIEEHAGTFLNEHTNKLLNPHVVQRLQKAKQNGHRTYLISSSPQFLVKPIAKFFGIDEWYATRYHVDVSNKFCAVEEINGSDKAQFLISEAKKLNIPLSQVTAYSDSHLDLPMLEIVGTVVGVNPDRILRKICQKNKWEILELPKN